MTMPAINQYAFDTLVHLAHGAREAFLAAKLRPESDVETFATTTFAKAINSTPARPENLARLTDAYVTALSGYRGEPFNGAFRRAAETLGRSDMVNYGVIFAALGSRPAPECGGTFNEASYR